MCASVFAARARAAHVLVIGLLALALAACSMITPKRMVPAEASTGPERKIAQSVRVLPVVGAFHTGYLFASPKQYHEAVVRALTASGLFTAVSPSAGDVDLLVTLLSRKQEGMIPTTVRVVANYTFTSRGGAHLWSGTYDSSFSAGDLGGATRVVNAIEGAVRENLKAFVQDVRASWRS